MAVMFHSRTGSLVTLKNGNRTAQRNLPAQEFNNGMVMSAEPLRDNQLFEVRLDEKINSWSGSIEIGVTTRDPNTLDFPASATDLRENCWIMSGSSILRDGRSIIEEYGYDLDKLVEGDRVGVMRTSHGDLVFFVNDVNQGIAASNIPQTVYAVVDMYGKCSQITILESHSESQSLSSDISNSNLCAADLNNMANNISINADKLRFHDRCGSLVKLSNNKRAAERRRPLDEFNNGVVMTHRPLRDNELFEIRIDRLVDKWSGSIEVGITTHNPATLEFPATMTNMRSGTIMMSGCGILTNGKGTRREYGEYNLDELVEGDKIGLMRKSNGNLHYYINNMDQGIAAVQVPQVVFGVVDLYGMTVKVTIVGNDDSSDQELSFKHNNNSRNNNSLLNGIEGATAGHDDKLDEEIDRLLFHPRCGSHVTVIFNGRTACRPNAVDDFNNAVVLTNRPLHTNELFEVILDKVVYKWAGSIEIGVTTHSPMDLDFPSTMTNIRSGTWMMTGNGIMHNGTTVIYEYGQSLDELKVGDRVGVIRKDNGTLHFYVNGIDQGPAASNVPEKVYGVVDLFGQAAQATLIDHLDRSYSSLSNATNFAASDLRFHHLRGRNARISNCGLTASRPNAYGEFNDSIVISNRPLRDDEIFEVVIEKIVDRWSGSLEAGVTAIRPEDLEFPNTMTDIDYDTWMLSGSAVMQDGSTIRNGYKCDLDSLSVNSRIGMSRHSDGTLHYYINGEDQGAACSDIPPNVYAVIDLYGQCAQVSIAQPSCRTQENIPHSQFNRELRMNGTKNSETSHHFSQCCGKNVILRNNNLTASRIRSFNHGLLFSSSPIEPEELFEVRIDQMAKQWSGSLQIGLTTLSISDSYSVSLLPPHSLELNSGIDTWILTGNQVCKNGIVLKENFGPSLDRLSVGDHVGVKFCADGTMHAFINGEDVGIAATQIPKKVFAVVDLYGPVEAVTVTSKYISYAAEENEREVNFSNESHDSLEYDIEMTGKENYSQEFHENHGRNIQLGNKNLTARRTASYNQGVLVSRKPLSRGQLFQVRIECLNSRWTSSLLIGVTGQSPEKMYFPITALGLKKSAWIVCNDCVFQNGIKIKGRYGPNLDSLQVHHVIGVLVDTENRLHLYINGIDQGVAAKDIPLQCFAVLDLYGQCEEVTITSGEEGCVPLQDLQHREKADFDNGKKEKPHPFLAESTLIKNCDYMNACLRIKALLGVPEGYFISESSTCFCDSCHKIRGGEAYIKKGDPLKDSAVPLGWCRFSLRFPAKVEQIGTGDKWHIAFHGTKLGEVRKTLDHGELLLPGDVGLGPNLRSIAHKNKSTEGNGNGSQISFSPTIRYAGHSMFCPKYNLIDPKTKKSLNVQVAFQILVRPASYKIGPQRIGAREPIDVHFNNSEIEWFTKERGAILLHSLLIRLEGL